MKHALTFVCGLIVVAVAYATVLSTYALISIVFKHQRIQQPSWYCLEMVGSSSGDSTNFLWDEVRRIVAGTEGNLTHTVYSSIPRSTGVMYNGSQAAPGYTEISGDILKVLGLDITEGRSFSETEYLKSEQVALISKDLARRLSIKVGKDTILVDRKPCTVIGVFRKRVTTPVLLQSEVYVPQGRYSNQQSPWDPSYNIFVELRTGVPANVFEKEFSSRLAGASQMCRMVLRGKQPVLVNLSQLDKQENSAGLLAILVIGLLIFGVAVGNVGGLLIIEVIDGESDLKIRAAMGANWRDIYWVCCRRCLWMATVGVLLGWTLAAAALPLLCAACRMSWAEDLNVWSQICAAPDYVAASASLAALLWLALTVFPARQASRIINQSQIHVTTRGASGGRWIKLFQNVYMSVQLGAAVVVLSFWFLVFRSVDALKSVDVGFSRADRTKILFEFPANKVTGTDDRHRRVQRILDAFKGETDIRAAAVGTDSLLSGHDAAEIPVSTKSGERFSVAVEYVSAGYLDSSGMRIITGSWFARDNDQGVVINESFARKYFGGTMSALGGVVRSSGDASSFKQWQVIGIVRDVRTNVREPAAMRLYLPWGTDWSAPNTFVIWHARALNADLIRQRIYRADPDISIIFGTSLDQVFAEQILFDVTMERLLSILGTVAAIVCLLGCVASFSQKAAISKFEFGIRLALGATPQKLAWAFALSGLWRSCFGLLIGAASIHLVLAKIDSGLLVQTSDERLGLICVAAGSVVACIACALPAVKRILRIEPSILLKSS